MKNKRSFLLVIGFFLIMAALSITGCENITGSDVTTSGTSTTNADGENGGNSGSGNGGNTGNGNITNNAGRLYFIKMAEQTETSGTLCFLSEGSNTVYTFPNKNMTGFSVNKEHSLIVFAEVLSGYSGTYLAFIKTDGSSYSQTNIRGSNPSFDIEGDKVYFDDGGVLYSINIDGTDKQQIDVPGVDGTKRFPRISPDGSKLAFYQSSPGAKWYSDDVVYLYVCDLITGDVTKLNNTSVPVSYLNWSPDGTEIAFSTTTGITPPICELWTVKADGSEQPVRIADSGSPSTGACGFPSYTEDGFILCGTTKNKILNWRSSWDGSHYKYELAKIKPDGTSMVILLPEYSVKDPVWVSAE